MQKRKVVWELLIWAANWSVFCVCRLEARDPAEKSGKYRHFVSGVWTSQRAGMCREQCTVSDERI